jgi:DNA-binding SARP family transcriptional activator
MNLRTALLDRIERARPRVVRIVAGAGWGKSTFVRALAARTPPAAVIEAAEARDREQFEALVLDVLAEDRGPVEAGSLREAWSAPGPPALVALEDLHLLDEGALDAVRMMLRTLPPGRTVVLTSRDALPFELSPYFAPHEIVSLGAEDLALTDAERRAVIGAEQLDAATLEHAVRLSRGWPICTYLFGRLAREGRLPELLDRLEDRAFDDLYAYTESEILSRLDPADLDLLLLCASSPTIEADDVRAVLGPHAPVRLEALVTQKRFVTKEGDAYRAPILGAALVRNRPADVAAMRARCAAARDERGEYCDAAALWLANGEPDRAAASLDRVGPPVAGAVPSRPYLRTLLRVPLEALLRTRHAFVVLLTCPRIAASPYALEARAREICERIGPDAGHAHCISAQLALAVFSFFASHLRRADDLLDRIEHEHAGETFAPERARVFAATRAAVWALRGRTVDGAALWAASALDEAHDRTVYEVQRFTMRVAIAVSAGEIERLAPEIARQVAMARESGDPLWIADVRVTERVFSTLGDDPAVDVEEFLQNLEREELRVAEPADYHHIVRPAELPPESRSILSGMVLVAMAYEQSDPLTAQRMLEEAIAGFDRIGRPHYQISARLLLAFVPGAQRARLLDEARRIAAEVQDPRTLESVEAIAAGRFAEARAFPFPARRIGRARFDVPATSLRVEILGARVTRAGSPLALRAREFEVLAALALARVPLAPGALAARLWGEDAAEDAAPALRTAIHRLRKQLGDPDAVVYENGAYRAGKDVTVDVHDIEAVLGALRRLESLTLRERDRLAEIARALAVEPPEVYQGWDWMRPHLAHLFELRHRATMLLGDDALAHGAPEDAVAIADAVLRVEPLDEPVVELSVRALLAGGRRAEAVRRARRYAGELARDLGGEPVSELLRRLAADGRETAAAR